LRSRVGPNIIAGFSAVSAALFVERVAGAFGRLQGSLQGFGSAAQLPERSSLLKTE
jgi:hypothetical protein